MDEILARAGIFQGVEPSAASALTKQLQPVDFPRGHTVFAEGEPGDRLYDIISGKIKIGRRSQDGRENLLTIMGPSDIFGELSVFDPGPRTSSWEERPLAVIQLRPGAEVSDDELCEHLMSRMASWQVPERWVRVDGIPRTGVGQARQATAAKPLCGGGAAARVDLLRGPSERDDALRLIDIFIVEANDALERNDRKEAYRALASVAIIIDFNSGKDKYFSSNHADGSTSLKDVTLQNVVDHAMDTGLAHSIKFRNFVLIEGNRLIRGTKEPKESQVRRLQKQREEPTRPLQQFLGYAGSATFGIGLVYYIAKYAVMQLPATPFVADARTVGIKLFEAYIFPFEAVSILLLAAIVGALFLSARHVEESA